MGNGSTGRGAPGPSPAADSRELEALRREKQRVVAAHGAWTDHNIHLGGGHYTIGPEVRSPRLRRTMQIVADAAARPLSGLRALDLGCLEGMYAIELARRGAETVAIEGREANLAKVRFARDALGLDNLTLRLEDVRALSAREHGEFDVVLCLGLLYHLDAPDVFRFVASLAEVTRGFAVIDTYVSTAPRERHEHAGRHYWGLRVAEHDEGDSAATRAARLWNSLDNASSLWLTRASLLNLLADGGFTSVHESVAPRDPHQPADRVTLLAFRGRPERTLSAPLADEQPVPRWPERERRRPSPEQDPRAMLWRRARRALPRWLEAPARRVLRALGRGADQDESWKVHWRAEPRPPRGDAPA